MRQLMTLAQLAGQAGISRQTTSNRVKALDLGTQIPGKKRLMFCECDLKRLRGNELSKYPTVDEERFQNFFAKLETTLKLAN